MCGRYTLSKKEHFEQMLEEAFESRGRPMHERKIFAVEHRVVMAGCAIAAVTLLSAEDLVA